MLGELGLALDTARALGHHEGLESLLAQPAQDVDGRDVGIALGAAGVLAFGEDRGRCAAHLVFAQRRVGAQNAGVAREVFQQAFLFLKRTPGPARALGS
jgi:hypothetical protein